MFPRQSSSAPHSPHSNPRNHRTFLFTSGFQSRVAPISERRASFCQRCILGWTSRGGAFYLPRSRFSAFLRQGERYASIGQGGGTVWRTLKVRGDLQPGPTDNLWESVIFRCSWWESAKIRPMTSATLSRSRVCIHSIQQSSYFRKSLPPLTSMCRSREAPN